MVEEWKAIPGYEGVYEVSAKGRVRSLERRVNSAISGNGTRRVRARELKQGHLPAGYPCVTLSMGNVTRKRTIAALVALAFLGPRPAAMDVCHNDGDNKNSDLTNLRYDTRRGNLSDRECHGTMNTGARNGKAKLTVDQVEAIRAARGLVSDTKLAKHFGVAQTTVSRLMRGTAWR